MELCHLPNRDAISILMRRSIHLAETYLTKALPLTIDIATTGIYSPHFLATRPSGGCVSTGPFLTSAQFVLSAVPLLSW